MPFYLYQGAYSSETWARVTKNPEDREAAIRTMTESVGGKLVGLWFMFGDDDVIAIAELADDAAAGALGIAVAASGAMRQFRTTPLITAQEAMEMMRRAASVGYRPAGA